LTFEVPSGPAFKPSQTKKRRKKGKLLPLEAKSFPGQPQRPRHLLGLSPTRIRDPCVGSLLPPHSELRPISLPHTETRPPPFPSPQLLSTLYYTLLLSKKKQTRPRPPAENQNSPSNPVANPGHGSGLSPVAAGAGADADGLCRSQ